MPDLVTVHELDLVADLLDVRQVDPFIAGFLRDGEAEDVGGGLELALHEICVNVVRHAYGGGPGRIRLRARATATEVSVLVTDEGIPFDPASAPEPVPGVPQIHGYGLSIARQILDELTYTRQEGHNSWLLLVRR